MSKKHLLPILSLLLAACGAAPSSDDSTESDALASSSTIAPGYYVFGRQEGAVDRWIEAVNLHADGSYDADFGNDVSNLSGHHFLANGTFAIDAKTKTISFSEGAGAADPYRFRVQNGALELQFIGDALEPQNWFSLVKQPSPVTLTFGADWSVTQSGPLHAGDTALVRYAASRARCTGNQASNALEYVVDGGKVGNEFFGAAFPQNAVHGTFDMLVTIPSGHDLAFYFTSQSDGCNGVDSSFGKNYHFAIE